MSPKKKRKSKPRTLKTFYNNSPITFSFLSCLALIILIVLSYASSLGNPFYFDTPLNLQEESLKNLLVNFSLLDLWQKSRAFVWLTFGLNYHFWGMEAFAFRLVSLLFHIANTLLVYIFLSRLFACFDKGKRREQKAISRASGLCLQHDFFTGLRQNNTS